MKKTSPSRSRLTARHIEKMLDSISGRHEARDRCLILLMLRHGLRVSETCALRLRDVDLTKRELKLRGSKAAADNKPLKLRADEVKALKAWLVQREAMTPRTNDMFISANRTQISRKTVWLLLRKHAKRAKLTVTVNPDMLREFARAE